MRVYWRTAKRGENLVISQHNGTTEERIGGYRETKKGIDAYAATFGYDPDRSQKGFDSVDDAKTFVESFRPWELYGAHDIAVETEVLPAIE